MLTQSHDPLRATDPVIRVNAADCTSATGIDTTAVGLCSKAGNGDGSNTSGATAMGSNAWALNQNSTAVGFRATVTADNAVALGASSVANEANTVSVGSASNQRRITNVAAAMHDSDAVNLGQLKTAYAGVAMSLATTNAYLPNLTPGKKGFGAGLGYYKGQAALGVNFKSIAESGNQSMGGGIATNGKDVGVSVGFGWSWE